MVERIEQLIGFDRVEGFCIQHAFIGVGWPRTAEHLQAARQLKEWRLESSTHRIELARSWAAYQWNRGSERSLFALPPWENLALGHLRVNTAEKSSMKYAWGISDISGIFF